LVCTVLQRGHGYLCDAVPRIDLLAHSFPSHCDTCKSLGGGAYSLNQIVPKSAIDITKGSLKAYTYYGESGTFESLNSYAKMWVSKSTDSSQEKQSTATTAPIAPVTSTITRRSWAQTPSYCAPSCSMAARSSSQRLKSSARPSWHGSRKSLRLSTPCLRRRRSECSFGVVLPDLILCMGPKGWRLGMGF
jgi:hypothetical protein